MKKEKTDFKRAFGPWGILSLLCDLRERERTIEKEIPVVDFVVEPWRCLAAATGAVEMWRLLQ